MTDKDFEKTTGGAPPEEGIEELPVRECGEGEDAGMPPLRGAESAPAGEGFSAPESAEEPPAQPEEAPADSPEAELAAEFSPRGAADFVEGAAEVPEEGQEAPAPESAEEPPAQPEEAPADSPEAELAAEFSPRGAADFVEGTAEAPVPEDAPYMPVPGEGPVMPEDVTVSPEEEQEAPHKRALPAAVTGKAPKFAVRMGEASYTTGRRYDAVKNAFLSYKPAERRKKPIRARITGNCETFGVGRSVYAKLALVGGYLRLFLALDPKQYSEQKYHQKDYSEVARYAKTPFMIKLSSDRQVKHAIELIDEVMRANGYVPDENYVPKDQAGIFKAPRKKPKVVYVEREAPAPEPQIVYVEREVPAAAEAEEAAAEAMAEVAAAQPEIRYVPAPAEEVGEPGALEVKLPKRGRIVDREGNRIGTLRASVWYDGEEEEVGAFRKEETNVFFYDGTAARAGYLDANDNILSLANKYIASIRRIKLFPLLLILILAAVTLLSVILAAYFLTRSDGGTAEFVIVADAEGTAWEDMESLPVFMNERFGDTIIAPGMEGSYIFAFENRNENSLSFSLAFSEENEYGIELLYRLKRDGAYISGTEYVAAEQLSIDGMTIEALSTSVFEIEWYWQDNDAADTAAGENGATYTLHISYTASVGTAGEDA